MGRTNCRAFDCGLSLAFFSLSTIFGLTPAAHSVRGRSQREARWFGASRRPTTGDPDSESARTGSIVNRKSDAGEADVSQTTANMARVVMQVIDHGLPAAVSLQHASAFFEIGYAELWEATLLDITSMAQRCHLSRSAATRTVATLSDIPGGLGLISIQLEPVDRRRKRLLLTTNGRQVYFASLNLIKSLSAMEPDEMLSAFRVLDERSLLHGLDGHGNCGSP